MDADDRVRAGSYRDLRVPRPRYRHANPCCGLADVVAAHRGGDVHAQLLHQQSNVDGADLAIGFLVDDAIVFLENVVRRAEHGESILKATFNSAGEISFTILSMTLSLAAVFIPLVFIPGCLAASSANFPSRSS
jgi:hypothetical protein